MATIRLARLIVRIIVRGRRTPLIAAMIAVALVAFAPPLVFPQRDGDAPPIAVRQLEDEARRGFFIPPGVMRITAIRASGDYAYRVEGTAVYRALFVLLEGTLVYALARHRAGGAAR